MSALLNQLLQHPAIRRANDAGAAAQPTVRSGFSGLDDVLPHGGWPLATVSELLVDQPGNGELGVLLPLLATLTARSREVVLVAPPHIPYAPALVAAGVKLARLTWVVVSDARTAIWAFEQTLREPACGACVAWIEQPMTDKNSRRLILAAERGGCMGLVLRPNSRANATTPFALRLALQRRLNGIEVRVIKRRGAPLAQPIIIAA